MSYGLRTFPFKHPRFLLKMMARLPASALFNAASAHASRRAATHSFRSAVVSFSLFFSTYAAMHCKIRQTSFDTHLLSSVTPQLPPHQVLLPRCVILFGDINNIACILRHYL